MKITTITAKGNKSIPASKITVLVGPNNTGKSQFLRDVMSIMTSTDTNPEGVLIEEIEFEKIAPFDELMKGVKTEPASSEPR